MMRPDEVGHANSINQRHINTMCFSKLELPPNITATINEDEALENVTWIIHAVPVQFTSGYLAAMKDKIPPNVPMVSVSKGICLKTLRFMNEIIPAALGREQPTAFLCGPSFAEGIIRQDPTAVVVASSNALLARSAQCLLSTANFRVYTTTDVKGLEIGSALKNVLAIAAGMAYGLGYGANSATFLVTRGWAEIRKIAVCMGAEERTLAGLAGVGDLMLTCFGGSSRNANFGKLLATNGGNVKLALEKAGGVVEGFPTAKACKELGEKHNLELPIISAIADTLSGRISPQEMMSYIMTFTLGKED
uniref:Glycerol-3-phosphate dehydrogenase [NAD(+)] n=1 Tax=Arcella intermedia TaxID=1963864 RepID=A0A6B2LA54_9EUKA